MNLVKKNKDTQGVVKLDRDGRRVKSYGNYTFNKTEPTISAKKTVKQEKNNRNNNRRKIDVTFTYKEQPQNNSSAFQVQTAEFKFTMEWGRMANVNQGDYWNLTSAGLTVTGKIGDKDTLSADLTPQVRLHGQGGRQGLFYRLRHLRPCGPLLVLRQPDSVPRQPNGCGCWQLDSAVDNAWAEPGAGVG